MAKLIGVTMMACLLALGCSRREAAVEPSKQNRRTPSSTMTTSTAKKEPVDYEKRVKELVQKLEDSSILVRRNAARSLASLGGKAKDAIPPLKKATKDEDEQVRGLALVALAQISPDAETMTKLFVALEDSNDYVRRSAGPMLDRIVPDKSTVPVMVAQLKNDYEPAQKAAIEILGRMGPAAAEGAPALSAVLKDNNIKVKQMAAKSLGQIGPEAKKAVPNLIEAIKDPQIRSSATQALYRICTDKSSLPLLKGAIVDPDDRVRQFGFEAMTRIGKEATPDLIKALRDRRTAIRMGAAKAIGKVGPDAKAAVPDLIRALNDPDAEFRGQCADSLVRVGPDETALPALSKAIKDKDPAVSRRAADAMVIIGKPSVPILIKAAKGFDTNVLVVAANALGRIGPDAKEAIPALKTLLKDDEEEVQEAAALAIKRIEAEPKKK